MPSRAWSLGTSGPGESGQTGPCGEEAARCARDTVCRAPPPACCLPVGAQGLGSKDALSEGDLLSCPGLWKGPGAPAGCWEVVGPVPAALFPTALLHPGISPRRRVGEGVAMPWVSRALGLSDHFIGTAFVSPSCHLLSSCQTLDFATTQATNDEVHGHLVTQMWTESPKAGDASKTPKGGCRAGIPGAPMSSLSHKSARPRCARRQCLLLAGLVKGEGGRDSVPGFSSPKKESGKETLPEILKKSQLSVTRRQVGGASSAFHARHCLPAP